MSERMAHEVQPLVSSPSSTIERVGEKRKAFWQRRWIDKVVFLILLVMAALLVNGEVRNWRQSSTIAQLRSELSSYSTRSEESVAQADQRLSQLESRQSAMAAQPAPDPGRKYGLIEPEVMRRAAASFLELYSYDNQGSSSYGTAGYLGRGYFITVKHGVVALGQVPGKPVRVIHDIRLNYRGENLPVRLVDVGNAPNEVDPGDWAIVWVDPRHLRGLKPLTLDLGFKFEFAEPIFRLGNDYSKGVIPTVGYVGRRMRDKLVSCLTDGHPGVSGGGVLSANGKLVAIPVGRMQGDYRFSFILPLRPEMFRKVPHLRVPPA
jgi:hypothetical protein